MKKKTYIHPSMKVIQLESNDIICTSGISTMSINEDVGGYDEGSGVSQDIWGKQW